MGVVNIALALLALKNDSVQRVLVLVDIVLDRGVGIVEAPTFDKDGWGVLILVLAVLLGRVPDKEDC